VLTAAKKQKKTLVRQSVTSRKGENHTAIVSALHLEKTTLAIALELAVMRSSNMLVIDEMSFRHSSIAGFASVGETLRCLAGDAASNL
jgi:hypothetical protein